ncbi:hypothetical protein SODALDRAFT_379098 [Sodiomyces alkalinus F11]|uniref:Uncharacterized protein n=1 Tax=Sodiomyces alkalinus (strain CBS 110278 / VKM F-3762 / F11) TaxID=1314773 RepID=A0A3N2PTJ6_SODAK|nr:hypothetical protein SODALDRAFT_379098 [Sodiomyces alkalinus F11]ROT37839.1 hypothetical protein SODALDRAFT_379098 [Sodiomyces alkalinus F11]
MGMTRVVTTDALTTFYVPWFSTSSCHGPESALYIVYMPIRHPCVSGERVTQAREVRTMRAAAPAVRLCDILNAVRCTPNGRRKYRKETKMKVMRFGFIRRCSFIAYCLTTTTTRTVSLPSPVASTNQPVRLWSGRINSERIIARLILRGQRSPASTHFRFRSRSRVALA